MYDVVVKKEFTFAISSPDEFLVPNCTLSESALVPCDYVRFSNNSHWHASHTTLLAHCVVGSITMAFRLPNRTQPAVSLHYINCKQYPRRLTACIQIKLVALIMHANDNWACVRRDVEIQWSSV